MKKLQTLRKALNEKFLEREQVVDGLLVALLSKQNLFLIGPPGTGKSALTEAVCQAIGGKHFAYILSKFTTPDELYGPVSLEGLQNSSFERVTTGRLPEASIGFIDEIFKGSSAILNTLLPIMNERVFYNGTTPQKIPLQVLFGASNEIPEQEELAAMFDRFALKYVTARLTDDTLARNLFQTQNVNIPQISLADLASEQAAAAALTLPDDVIDALLAIRADIAAEGIYVSDRKWVQTTHLIRAYAHLNGGTVSLDSLDILEHALWNNPDARRSVSKIIQKHANPIGEKIGKIMDAVYEIQASFSEMTTGDAAEVAAKLRKSIDSLRSLGEPQKNAKLSTAIATTEKLQRQVIEKKLGFKL